MGTRLICSIAVGHHVAEASYFNFFHFIKSPDPVECCFQTMVVLGLDDPLIGPWHPLAASASASSFFSFLPLLELDLPRLGVFSPSGLSVALTFSLMRADRLGVSPAYKLFRGSSKTLNIGVLLVPKVMKKTKE